VRILKDGGKPVVVSMGATAASGGYYLSAPATRIYAEPATITGSIGVLAEYPVLAGTLEKIGLDVVTIKSTQSQDWKDVPSLLRQPKPEERQYLQALLDQMHTRFAEAVAAGRQLSPEELAQVSNGKVWLAEDAKRLKLVDQIGYRQEAISYAASAAGVTNPHVVQYRYRKGLGALLAEGRAPGVSIDERLVEQIRAPRMLMLWRP
jgi:protease-4